MRTVKKYYFEPRDPRAAFGKELGDLEAEWLAWLDETPIDIEKMARALDGELAIFEKRITGSKREVRIQVTADDVFLLELNGKLICAGSSWMRPKVVSVRLQGKDRLRVLVVKDGGAGGLLLDMVEEPGSERVSSSDESWDVTCNGSTNKARILEKPLSGAWGIHADEKGRAALAGIRGCWIWSRE